MSTLPSLLAVAVDAVDKLATYSSIVFDDIFLLTKTATGRALAGGDVAGLIKPAVSKASGVVVDDLTVVSSGLNESEIAQERETKIVVKIIAGSLLNKAVLTALIYAAEASFPIIPQIMLGLGGCYLALEGAHKLGEYGEYLGHRFFKWQKKHGEPAPPSPETPPFFTKFLEKPIFHKSIGPFLTASERFWGTNPKERAVLKDLILLDAILSTEILLIAKSTLGSIPLIAQISALGAVALVTTFGVYGIVYAVVRTDNVAAHFANPENKLFFPSLGQGMMKALPYALHLIGFIGTIAMLGVAGEVLGHMLPQLLGGFGLTDNAEALRHSLHSFEESAGHTLPFGGRMTAAAAIGSVAGALLIGFLAAPRIIKQIIVRGRSVQTL